MIPVTAKARGILGRSYRQYVRVQSWRGGELLHEDVPVISATEEGDRSLSVPTRIALTVPQRKRGYDWTPDDDMHPLAANGQQLTVQVGVGIGPEGIEWVDRGVFVILESEPDGNGGISVQAADLLYLVSEARFAGPYQATGTFKSTLRSLVEPALTVVYDPALVDRAVPADTNYDGSRLDAANELLNGWPAEAAVTTDGYLYVYQPVTPTAAVLALDDKVIKRSGKSTRDGAYNVVVVKGRTQAGADIFATVYDTDSSRSYGGPFNPLPVTYEYFHPAAFTVAVCLAIGRNTLARLKRNTGRERRVDMVPDPTLQLGDAVEDQGELWTIEKLSLPYTPGSAMTCTLRSVS